MKIFNFTLKYLNSSNIEEQTDHCINKCRLTTYPIGMKKMID